jgi:hypothetical protein
VQNIQNALRFGRAAGSYPSYGYMPGQSPDAQGSAQMRQIAESGQMATGQSSQSDMALAQQVAQKLRQQLTGIQNVQVARPGTIYVIVNKGTVTLDGLVSSNNLKQKAEQVAKSISGVQNVKNSLSISAAAGGSQAFGYIPPDEDQQGASQYGNQQFGNQRFGNRSGNQSLGYIPPDEDQSETQPYGDEQLGDQSSTDSQFGNQMGNQPSDEDQSGNGQPDEGTN